MQAFISGITGTALIVDGDNISSLQVDDPDSAVETTPSEVRQFLTRAHDAYAVENVEVDHVREHLEAAWEATAIFNLTQILLCPRAAETNPQQGPRKLETHPLESDATRALAAKELDESLQNALATELAERRLFSAELPGEYSEPAECSERVSAFVDRLVALQPAVQNVETAFSKIRSSLFISDDKDLRNRFLATSIREGLFRLMVLCSAGEKNKAELYFKLDDSPSLKSFRGHRAIMTEWLGGLDVTEQRASPQWIDNIVADEIEDKPDRFRRRQNFDRANELERVLAIQDQIEELLRQGKTEWAIENTAALVKEQIAKSGKEFACQTLCNLAMRAQEIGMHNLQLKWASSAVKLNPDDPVAKSQEAHALLKSGKPTEALEAYDQVISQHPENVVAKNGRAETLRSRGKYEEALEAYDQVISKHPENVFAKNGRAETLRSLGKYDEALEAYDQVISQHSENVVAKNAQAETLRSLGKHDEALETYDQVISKHPEDVVAKNGRAETLRSLGKYDEALEAYDQVISQHSENVFAKSGRAETLRSLGKYDEALETYHQAISQHPENVVAKSGRAETLRSLGKYDEALEAYDQVISQHPENVVAKTGQISTLVSVKRYSEALEKLKAIGANFAAPHRVDDWIALHIRAMIYLKTERLADAEQELNYGVETCQIATSHEYFVNALAIVQMKQKKKKDAKRTVERGKPSVLVSQLIRGLVLYENEEANTASTVMSNLAPTHATQTAEIRHQMKLKYVDKVEYSKPTDWFLDQLTDLLLAA